MVTRMVMLTAAPPTAAPETAGAAYVSALAGVLAAHAEVTVLAPDVPSARRALEHPPPVPVRLLGRGRGPASRGLNWVAHQLTAPLTALLGVMPPLTFVLGAVTRGEARAAIEHADVVDLQWQEYAAVAPLIRRLNPTARIIATLHDVLSQRFARYADQPAAVMPRRPAHTWRRYARAAAALERLLPRWVDELVVLSEKDAALLAPHPARVLRPPVSPSPGFRRAPATEPTVLFVANFIRSENVDAARWLIADIWPLLHGCVPDARLVLAGVGSIELVTGLGCPVAVRATGFLPSLEDEYAAAWAVAVPLRFGAGVKFKTVEAVVRGIPVVTTPVGAEGVAPAQRFHRVATTTQEFAAGLISVLVSAETASQQAALLAAWARDVFSPDRFAVAVGECYLSRGGP